ncbi:MAG: TetR/AcrR family transcriptional regulator [Chloroflexales bacterium]|nr:TetR/AcrR family transcriptional regulator [Chloroflexales bacterium]
MESDPTNTSSRAYHHGDLRNALIAAGRALLSEEGVSGLDLRKVARRAGVSHAAPYRHFADKQALLAAIAEDGFQRLGSSIDAALAAADAAPRDQLMALGWAYTQFALENPAHMREMFSGLTIDRATYPSLYAASKHIFNRTITMIQSCQARGALAAGDPTYITLAAWSQIHGLAMLLLEDQIPEARGNRVMAHELVRVCITTLYWGLAPLQESGSI